MPIKLEEENGGKLLVLHVSGKLEKEDYETFVPEFERLVKANGKLDVLFDMRGFHGWDLGALWADTEFALHHFRDMKKLAMIGDRKWEQEMAIFCKPFTSAVIKYFDQKDAAETRKWLTEKTIKG